MSSSRPRRRSRSIAVAGRVLDGSCNCISISTTSSRTRSGSRYSAGETGIGSMKQGPIMRRRVLLVVVALVSSALAASDALAHAFLDHARPAVGSTVHGSPAQLKLWFTQQLEPAFSTVQV